jgi:hypothetical protein
LRASCQSPFSSVEDVCEVIGEGDIFIILPRTLQMQLLFCLISQLWRPSPRRERQPALLIAFLAAHRFYSPVPENPVSGVLANGGQHVPEWAGNDEDGPEPSVHFKDSIEVWPFL